MTQTALLGDICSYVTEKIPVDNVVLTDYVSTENLIANKGGLSLSVNLPKVDKVTKFQEGDVLVSNIRPYFKKIWHANRNGGASNDVLVFRPKSQDISHDYLYYILKNDRFFDFSTASSGGSKMPRGDKLQIMKYPVYVPSLETQKKIADILGTIDEKIELNRKMNETLEQMGQALFRHYFIDNPGAEEWQEVKVSDLLEFIGGSQPPKSEHIYEKKAGYIRFVQNRDYSSNNHHTYIPVAKRNKVCNETDIMMDKYGEAGRVRFGIPGAYNVALAKIVPKQPNTQEYLRSYFSIPQIQKSLEGAAAASTRSSLNATTFAGLKINMPTSKLLVQFEDEQKTRLRMIIQNDQQIQTLIALRDTLLPRLINGKVRV